MDSSLCEVESLRGHIRDTFQCLHISLDERESELMYKLDEIRGTMVTALTQWNGRIEDVKHTISHANTEIRDNTWGFKLLKEAREELNILENAKPEFKIDFELPNGIEEALTNLGELSIKQTSKQTSLRDQLETNSPDNSPDFREEGGVFECPILNDPYQERFVECKKEFRTETNIPIVPIERVITMTGTKSKLFKSISCTELSIIQPKQEQNLVPPMTSKAFDDSCISNRLNTEPNFRKEDFPKPKERSKTMEIRKRFKSKKENSTHKKTSDKISFFPRTFKARNKTVASATYKLSELNIHKYLTHRVALTSRWDKTREVYGTLRCVVSRVGRIPVVGIQLDSNDGTCNGFYGGIQYFKTGKFMAYFLPADEVLITL